MIDVSREDLARYAKKGCTRCGSSGLLRGEAWKTVKSDRPGFDRHDLQPLNEPCPCAAKRIRNALRRADAKANRFAEMLDPAAPTYTEADHV